MRHFLRLFWSSQNRKSVIFELAPGPRSALGAPGDASAAVTDLSENYVQMRKCEWRHKKNLHRHKKEISGVFDPNADGNQNTKKGVHHKLVVFGRIMVSQHKMGSLQNRDTRGKPPPPIATPLQASVLLLSTHPNYRISIYY